MGLTWSVSETCSQLLPGESVPPGERDMKRDCAPPLMSSSGVYEEEAASGAGSAAPRCGSSPAGSAAGANAPASALAAEALAAAHPGWCACTYRSKPDHGKFATFTRCGDGAVSSAILGGINLGDRFVDWDDYAIRLPGESAEALATLCADEATGCDVDLASFAFSTDASVNSVAAAETIAYVSPVVALFTLLTTAAAFATLALHAAFALHLSQEGSSSSIRFLRHRTSNLLSPKRGELGEREIWWVSLVYPLPS